MRADSPAGTGQQHTWRTLQRGTSKLDESRISNPKSRNLKSDWQIYAVRQSNSRFLDFGFEILDSSNFEIPLSLGPSSAGLSYSLKIGTAGKGSVGVKTPGTRTGK